MGSTGFEPARPVTATATSGSASANFATSPSSPDPGSNGGPFPYEGNALTAELSGRVLLSAVRLAFKLPGLESNQRGPVSETGWDASNPPGNVPPFPPPRPVTGPYGPERAFRPCGRCDSNAQAAAFEVARYANSLHARSGNCPVNRVRRPRLERGTNGLRVRCSDH